MCMVSHRDDFLIVPANICNAYETSMTVFKKKKKKERKENQKTNEHH